MKPEDPVGTRWSSKAIKAILIPYSFAPFGMFGRNGGSPFGAQAGTRFGELKPVGWFVPNDSEGTTHEAGVGACGFRILRFCPRPNLIAGLESVATGRGGWAPPPPSVRTRKKGRGDNPLPC